MRGESHRLRIGSRGTTLVGLTLGALIVGLVLLQRSFASAGGAQRHTKIVFDRFIGPGPTIDYDVFVMNPDGSHRQRLTQNPAYDWAPAVSPNGRRIVFGSDRDGDDEIFKMRADGSRQHKLTRNNDADSEPAYSPSGKRIVFESDRDGDSEIFKMRADGSHQHKLTRNNVAEEFPKWGRLPR
jgi:Tol biopolymer transport system component